MTTPPTVTIQDLLPVETTSARETAQLGEVLAEQIPPGTLIALYGDLGSGKTQFAKGICRFFGIDVDQVTSPTFTIVNEYTSGVLPVFHIDAYRIQRLDELWELGFDSYLDDDAICIVEWPENIERALPRGCLRIKLSHIEGNRRVITWHDIENGTT